MKMSSAAAASTAEPIKAMTEWCDDAQWEKLDGRLSPGVWRRLMYANRALYAANVINAMLLREHLGSQDSEDNGAEFAGLPRTDVEALRIASIELGNQAERLLGEVRENAHGCCGT